MKIKNLLPFILLLVVASAIGQTNPSLYVLKDSTFKFQNLNPSTSTYPDYFQGWESAISFDQTPPVDDVPSGDAPLCPTTTCGRDTNVIFNNGVSGFGIQKYTTEPTANVSIGIVIGEPDTSMYVGTTVVFGLSTKDCFGISMAWKSEVLVEQIESMSKMSFQYRLDVSSDWTPLIERTNEDVLPEEKYYSFDFPQAVDDQDTVQLRWVLYGHMLNLAGQFYEELISSTPRFSVDNIYLEVDSITGIPRDTSTGYCKPVANLDCSGDNIYIDAVGMQYIGGGANPLPNGVTITNNSCGLDDGYSDYSVTNNPFEIIMDSEPEYRITVGLSDDPTNVNQVVRVFAYLDWNKDNDFSDLGESFEGVVLQNEATIEFTVPPTAVSGETRMRIRVISDEEDVSPCVLSASGEVEDHALVINNPLSTPPPCADMANAKPADGTQNFCEGDITLSWDSVPGVAGYELRIGDGNQTNLVVHETALADTFFVFSLAQYGHSYFWSIRPFNSDGSSASGCDFNEFTMVPIAPPIADITPENEDVDSICFNAEIQLNGNPQLGNPPLYHKWTGDVHLISDSAISNPEFSGIENGIKKLYYEVSDDFGCGVGIDSIEINVALEASVVGLSGSKETFCVGDTAELLFEHYAGNISFEELDNGNWLPFDIDQQTYLGRFLTPDAVEDTVYLRAISIADHCRDTSLTYTMPVAENPDPPLIEGGTDAVVECAYAPVKLVVVNYADHIVWDDELQTENDTVSIFKSGVYSASRVSPESGCSTTSLSKRVVLKEVPEKPDLQIEGDRFCLGKDTILVHVPFDEELTYKWNLSILNDSNKIFVTSDAEVILEVTNTSECVNRDTVEIVFYLSPQETILFSELLSPVCEGDTVEILNTRTDSIFWSTGEYLPAIQIMQNDTIFAYYENEHRCRTYSDTVMYNFVAAPDMPSIAFIETTPFDSLLAGGDTLLYQWFLNDTIDLTENDLSKRREKIAIQEPGVYDVRTLNRFGCYSPRSEKYYYKVSSVERLNTPEKTMLIHPNPSNAEVNITTTYNTNLRIIDIAGKEVMILKSQANRPALISLLPGVYIVFDEQNTVVNHQKIVISH